MCVLTLRSADLPGGTVAGAVRVFRFANVVEPCSLGAPLGSHPGVGA